MTKPYDDPERLHELFVVREMGVREIADELECSKSTIGNYIQKYGIERTRPWDDANELRELYLEDRLSSREIAERMNTSKSVILNALDRHGIETRTPNQEKPVHLTKDNRGYVQWRHKNRDGSTSTMYVHRLLAVSEFGIEEVKDMVVHHKNGCKYDNRPENIELMSNAGHASHHFGFSLGGIIDSADSND